MPPSAAAEPERAAIGEQRGGASTNANLASWKKEVLLLEYTIL